MAYRRKRQSEWKGGTYYGGLILVGILWIIIDLIKSARVPAVPADNWKNIDEL